MSILLLKRSVVGFQPTPFGRVGKVGPSAPTLFRPRFGPLRSDEQEDSENPEEFYPDLEFIDYSDPNYVIDQGMGDEFFPTPTAAAGRDNNNNDDDDTEQQIEAMREDRRRRNDEFQFETYFEKILKNGDEYCGEWTVYKTSTFLDGVPDEDAGYPRLVRARHPLKVKSRAYKIKVDTDSEFRVDGERICHEEIQVVAETKTNEAVSKEVSKEKLLLGGGRNVVAPLANTDYDHRLKKQRLK
jgi:hypothetical protein